MLGELISQFSQNYFQINLFAIAYTTPTRFSWGVREALSFPDLTQFSFFLSFFGIEV
jgi:hypothetical protein